MYYTYERARRTRAVAAIALGLGLALATPQVAFAESEAQFGQDAIESLDPVATDATLEDGQPTEVSATQNLQMQLELAYQTLDNMYLSLEQTQAELSKATYELEQTGARIDEIQRQTAQNTQTLATRRDLLGKQVSESYKLGNPSFIGMLLGTEDIEHLTRAIYYNNKVAEKLSKSIDEVRELQTRLDSEHAQLEALKIEQSKQVQSEQQKAQALQTASEQQNAYINQLSDELKVAIAEDRAKQAQESLAVAQEALANATDEISRREAELALSEAQSAADSANSEVEQTRAATGATGAAGAGYVSLVHAPSAATSDQRIAAVDAALTQIGVPYSFGCETPGVGFDCNGLTHWAWAQAGVEIPYPSGRTMYGQFQMMRSSGRWVSSRSDLQPGDLVFYSRDGGATIYHVAMYVGGNMVVHANGYRWGVMLSSIDFDEGFCGGGSPI